jgi:hypothetical protein
VVSSSSDDDADEEKQLDLNELFVWSKILLSMLSCFSFPHCFLFFFFLTIRVKALGVNAVTEYYSFTADGIQITSRQRELLSTSFLLLYVY